MSFCTKVKFEMTGTRLFTFRKPEAQFHHHSKVAES